MNILWFKRDLRDTDHAPLAEALESGPTIGLFLIEPEWLQSPEFGVDHLRFVLESLKELRDQLATRGVPLLIRQGSALQVFDQLHRQHPIKALHSHEETGLKWSYDRDLKMKAWLRSHGIPWIERRHFGVVRALRNRDQWAQARKKIIERPLITPRGQSPLKSPWSEGHLPLELLNGSPLKPLAQKGGRREAEKTLRSFFHSRGEQYFRSMSSPLKAYEGCSRLSPYLAWGLLSMTEVELALRLEKKARASSPAWRMSFQSLESRLWWHCHFIQKLEKEPEIEFENFNRQFNGLRESEFDEAKFQAWCKGETGFPLIDACMRSLHQHGWINFRMRAMLMSFASYQLWLHWKKPAEFLARHFLDFEPGIHYSQAQMQSGVTGINTIRIYSPSKQLKDQDPEGFFVRKYVPELSQVSNADLAEPQLMPPLLQMESGFQIGRDYPAPIVDPVESYKKAQERIFTWLKRPALRAESKKVLQKHGSRKTTHFPVQNRGLK
jgi:deoxyribodipyrimidine photo-lyase